MDKEQEHTNSDEQNKNRNYEWLKPWHFKPGQTGNPNGRPKGAVSLKTYAKKYLQTLTEEEKLKFLEGLDKETIWKMAEGNPHNTEESTVEVMLPKPILDVLPNNSDQQNKEIN